MKSNGQYLKLSIPEKMSIYYDWDTKKTKMECNPAKNAFA
jgi:hypothetical protein